MFMIFIYDSKGKLDSYRIILDYQFVCQDSASHEYLEVWSWKFVTVILKKLFFFHSINSASELDLVNIGKLKNT